MAADGGTVELTYQAKLDQLEREMSGLKSKVGRHADEAGDGFSKRFTSKLGSAGAMAGKALAVGLAGAAVGVGGFLAKAVSSASDLEETMSKVGVVFGQTKDQVVADAEFMAKKFGIPKQQFLDASASIGLIGKASGMAQSEVGTFSTDMARLATDASSFYNVPLDEALAAIQSGLIGEAEPMRKFGVLLSENTMKEEAYALGIAARGAELTEGQKVQARASLIMKGMSDATGDLERTQGSLANRLRELKGRAENFAASVGTAVVPMLLKFMDAGAKVAGVVGPAMKGLFDIFAKRDFTGGFSALGIEEDSPIIAKLFVMRDKIAMAFAQVKAIVFDFVTAFKLALSGESFEAMTGPQKAAQVIVDVMRTIVTVVTGAVDIVMTLWNNFGQQIMAYTQAAFSAAMTIIGGAMEMIRGIVATVTALIHGDWSAAWDGIKQILSGALHAILGLAAQWDNMMRTLMSVAMEILTSIIKSAFNGIVTFVASIPGRILGALGNLGSLLYQAGRDLIMGMLNGIKSMAGALAAAAKSVASGAVNAVKGFLGIGSPSKLFMGFGVNVGQGLAIGMERSVGLVAGAGDVLASAAGGYGSSLNMSSMGHSSAGDADGSSSGARPINVGPFYVRENDLPTEIPRRLRGALHMWS